VEKLATLVLSGIYRPMNTYYDDTTKAMNMTQNASPEELT